MKRLLFRKIQLLSLAEQRAKEVTFHPRMNIVQGKNDTGKSSLLKSVYWVLGCEPAHMHPKWKDANPIGRLEFEVDSVPYSIIRWSDRYLLFDKQLTILKVFESVTNELAPFFAEVFNFNIVLSRSQGEAIQATPAFLFLPFYLDQDASWQSSWSSFERLQQFSKWKQDVCYFHTGIRPSEYYQLKAEKQEHISIRNSLELKRDVLADTLGTLEEKMNTVDFDFDLNDYQDEIKRLVKKSNEIKEEQFVIKNKMLETAEDKRTLIEELKVLERAEKELRSDYDLALKHEDSVQCPTCGNDYKNGIVERFHIAKDEYRCKELTLEIKSELEKVIATEKKLTLELDSLREKETEIRDLLKSKKGEIKLQDIVELQGKKEVKNIISSDIDDVMKEHRDELSEIHRIATEMKPFSAKSKRAKDIKELYQKRMKIYLNQLNVLNLPDSSYKRMDCTIKETGSDLPRALLAYYFAIVKVIESYSTSTFCPLVIDSPKQQDQDAENWLNILDFITSNSPSNTQVIMGLVDSNGFDFESDVNIITLTEKNHLLSEADFDKVSNAILPLLDLFVVEE